MALLAVGFGILNPAVNSLVSRQAGADERGGILGVNQSGQSLARILGPLIAGSVYGAAGRSAPYYVGAIIMAAVVCNGRPGAAWGENALSMSRDRGGQRRRIDRVSEVGFKDELKAVTKLLPYLWPRDNRELRIRVLIAVALLIGAKSLTVYVPMLYKHAVDALSPGKALVIAVPVIFIIGYGVARVCAQGFAELRDAVFAKVGQRAVRTVALATFRHLHQLSLRFHLERQTGGLSRSVERGIRGTEFLLDYFCSASCRPCSRSCSFARSCGGCTTGRSRRSRSRRSSPMSPSPSSSPTGGCNSAAR